MAVRVLVVDDAAFMRMMVKDILTKNGYEVVGEAENGMKALEKYQELKPDLTTMDITMPNLSGIEALREIKKISSNVKVVMVSAMGQEALIKEAVMMCLASIISHTSEIIFSPTPSDNYCILECLIR